MTVTGPWTLPAPADWQPPADLADFLDAEKPPVYLGFGSLSIVQPERIRELAVPHIADQPYWGRRIHEEGLGLAPLPLNHLTVDRLAERLRALTASADLAHRAKEAGETARAERGVSAAVEVLLP